MREQRGPCNPVLMLLLAALSGLAATALTPCPPRRPPCRPASQSAAQIAAFTHDSAAATVDATMPAELDPFELNATIKSIR